MPAGFKYDVTKGGTCAEVCRFDTVYRLSGGFNLVTDNLEPGTFIPPLAPLAVDFATRKATVVKNVKVVENAAADATTIKVAKGSFTYANMFLGTGSKGAQVASIDKTNADYDVITIAAALGTAVKAGDVLFESGAVGGTTVKNQANLLNYAYTKVEAGAAVDAVGRAFEIRETKLVAPISDKDKATLKGFYIFTL